MSMLGGIDPYNNLTPISIQINPSAVSEEQYPGAISEEEFGSILDLLDSPIESDVGQDNNGINQSVTLPVQELDVTSETINEAVVNHPEATIGVVVTRALNPPAGSKQFSFLNQGLLKEYLQERLIMGIEYSPINGVGEKAVDIQVLSSKIDKAFRGVNEELIEMGFRTDDQQNLLGNLKEELKSSILGSDSLEYISEKTVKTRIDRFLVNNVALSRTTNVAPVAEPMVFEVGENSVEIASAVDVEPQITSTGFSESTTIDRAPLESLIEVLSGDHPNQFTGVKQDKVEEFIERNIFMPAKQKYGKDPDITGRQLNMFIVKAVANATEADWKEMGFVSKEEMLDFFIWFRSQIEKVGAANSDEDSPKSFSEFALIAKGFIRNIIKNDFSAGNNRRFVLDQNGIAHIHILGEKFIFNLEQRKEQENKEEKLKLSDHQKLEIIEDFIRSKSSQIRAEIIKHYEENRLLDQKEKRRKEILGSNQKT